MLWFRQILYSIMNSIERHVDAGSFTIFQPMVQHVILDWCSIHMLGLFLTTMPAYHMRSLKRFSIMALGLIVCHCLVMRLHNLLLWTLIEPCHKTIAQLDHIFRKMHAHVLWKLNALLTVGQSSHSIRSKIP